MKLTQKERFIEETLRNITGLKIDDIDKVLKALMYLTLMNYSEDELIQIPYFGSFKIMYDGDDVTKDGRIAKLNSLYFPSNEVALNIGTLEDIRNRGGNISSLPFIKDIMIDIKNALECAINDNDLNTISKE